MSQASFIAPVANAGVARRERAAAHAAPEVSAEPPAGARAIGRQGDGQQGDELKSDELLVPFLRAADEEEAGRLLALLVEEHVAPIMWAVVRRKLRVPLRECDGGERNQDALEVVAELRAALLDDLLSLRAGRRERVIGNLRGYAAAAAYNACHRYLREKYPQRHSLKTRLRYLLTHHAGFALWEAEGAHALLAGRAAWCAFDVDDADAPHARPADDLAALSRTKLGGADARGLPLWEVVSAVLDAAGRPVELDDLVNVVAELRGLEERRQAFAEDEESRGARLESLADARPSAEEELERRGYLARLWAEILLLPRNQRAALLLNLRDARGGDALGLLPHTGVASIRQIAEAVGCPAEEFAALWNELPLDDARIAARLGLARQQVINLRKSARERLGRRMREFEEGGRERRAGKFSCKGDAAK